MSELSPTIRHRRLAAELRRLRLDAGLSPEDGAAALGISRPQLVKFETAAKKPPLVMVKRILDKWGRNEEHTLAVMAVARNVHELSWWQSADGILSGSFAELEEDAERMDIWNTELVPGLLQTADYARALIASGDLRDKEEIDKRVEVRMRRQAVLSRSNPPALNVVLDEAVLHRAIGGPEVMRGQLAALIDAGQRDNISIRILPAGAGPHAGIGEGSFTIFGFPRPMDLDVAYLESSAGPIYVEEKVKVDRSRFVHGSITDQSLTVEKSAALIRTRIEE